MATLEFPNFPVVNPPKDLPDGKQTLSLTEHHPMPGMDDYLTSGINNESIAGTTDSTIPTYTICKIVEDLAPSFQSEERRRVHRVYRVKMRVNSTGEILTVVCKKGERAAHLHGPAANSPCQARDQRGLGTSDSGT
ncbi:hypothetical protein ONZ51_g1698 [Trametes cubensis]|uniref:Uncharacterized protein n=1 Tax=Trametes cubensis TaxID=1111947 RepID=A0AAD7U100_9APHY|nr:hypothetical protein ONZ51_g1698 [Trametes cubensis]